MANFMTRKLESDPNFSRTRVQRRPVHGVLLLDKPLGLSSNDALHIGGAPFNTPLLKVLSMSIWTGASANLLERTIISPLPAAALNNFIFNSSGGIPLLDTYVQDDTAVDYTKFTIWYY